MMRAMARDGRKQMRADAAERTTPRVLAIVREVAAELHPEMPGLDRLDAGASIERDFGLDSLARVEIALRIERELGVSVSETGLAESETPGDLAAAVAAALGRPEPEPAAIRRTPAEKALAPEPDSLRTLIDALEWHARTQPDRVHIQFDDEAGGSALTFGALRRAAASVAAGLAGRGIGRGESVAIMLPTGREFFAAFYGAMYAGAVPVPVYPPARLSQIESHLRRVAGILANCRARALLTFGRAAGLAHLLRGSGTRIEFVITLPEQETAAEWTAPPLAAGDVAFLQYTSGSTGKPKGVVLTQANVLANLRAMQLATGVGSGDCFVSWLPLYHDMGLIGACFGALVYGFPLVLMSPFAFLSNPVRWLRAIGRHHATITAAPNFAFELCLNKIADDQLEGLDLGSLRMVFNGAEAVSAQSLERFAERFEPCGLRRDALMPVYGLAECALGLTFPPVNRGPLIDRIRRSRFRATRIAEPAPAGDPSPLSVVSCGTPLPGYSVRIVDSGGMPVGERSEGRIEFQGPSATRGYFENPDETARLFDGAWLDSGDLGYLAGGELYVTGRAKDIIIRGGQHIHPQELEEAVGALPGVRKGGVAVFPSSDPGSGTERLVVLVEVRKEAEVSRDELTAGVNALAVDLTGSPVDEVVIAPPRTVLKTSSGKLRRAACREAFEHGRLGAAPAAWVAWLRLSARELVALAARAARRTRAITWGLRALLVAGLVAPLLWLTVFVTPGVSRRRRAGASLVRLALRLSGMRPQLRGRNGTVGTAVYVANHASYLDGLLLMWALPADVAFIAKREFIGHPVLGPLLRRIGCVFVERFERQEAAAGARAMEDRLRRGESLVVFPEGTFHRAPGLLPFHMGAFSAAAAAAVPVVPVAICGSRSVLPEGMKLPRPAPLAVVVGAPIVPADAGWRSTVALRESARRHIQGEIGEADLERLPGHSAP
jgi:1-acyl-sn-glycerol-3-phosphate acyltransferase